MRLIDADALPHYTGYALSADEVATAVENAPTVDPVRHGHWNEKIGGGYVCSVCERFSDFVTNYCPHCGAKMEIDEKRD